jgi:ubiquinone/menaquinone biosynthesis C-methylase UbiE
MDMQVIQDYYGKKLRSSADLKTSACCTPADMPPWLRTLIAGVHDEVQARYYGCGLVAPALLEGARVLDLGCGSGRDAYVLAQLVGATGAVVGVDMTAEQLDVARRHVEWHRDRFGYANANTSFVEGNIEQLTKLGFEPNSFDIIVSNCVLNLARDKFQVLRDAFNLLKPGGEMYFADVYADRRLPEAWRDDPILLGECLGGALYWNDFLQIAKRAGFTDPRLVTDRPLSIDDTEISAKLGAARFYSATYRLFKLPQLEPYCEDFGQAVIYRGGVNHQESTFVLDRHHSIERGKVFPVCGNTWHMLRATRFAPHFDFIGDFSTHYGIFQGCGTAIPFAAQDGAGTAAGACC